jgi:hypothetical protein
VSASIHKRNLFSSRNLRARFRERSSNAAGQLKTRKCSGFIGPCPSRIVLFYSASATPLASEGEKGGVDSSPRLANEDSQQVRGDGRITYMRYLLLPLPALTNIGELYADEF